MKFKLKPVTGMLVAGLAASAYGCWSQTSTNICLSSGLTSGENLFPAEGGEITVTATADWENTTAVSAGTGLSTRSGTPGPANYCSGPGKFPNPRNTSHTESITWWDDSNNVGMVPNGSTCS